MTGKSHIATNIASAVTIGSGLKLIETQYTGAGQEVVPLIKDTVFPYLCNYNHIPPISWWVLASIAFLLGTLLPDCDSKTSILGRFVHLPFKHRTWTHSVWFLAIFAFLACLHPLGFYIFAGYFLHMFFDSLSRGGVCWFYPISKYRNYGNGAQVKKKHWCKLYHTGSISEGVVDGIVIVVALFLLGVYIYLNLAQTK